MDNHKRVAHSAGDNLNGLADMHWQGVDQVDSRSAWHFINEKDTEKKKGIPPSLPHCGGGEGQLESQHASS